MDRLRASSHPSRAAGLHRPEAEMLDVSGRGPLSQRPILPEREASALGARVAGGASEEENQEEEGREEEGREEEEAPLRERAPDFNLPLVGGGYRSLHDLLDPGGGILVFFKEECATSEMVVSRLGSLAKALEREDRFFLAIAEDDEETAGAFPDKHKLVFLLAWQSAPYHAAPAFRITTVPTILFVEGNRVIAERWEGFIQTDY